MFSKLSEFSEGNQPFSNFISNAISFISSSYLMDTFGPGAKGSLNLPNINQFVTNGFDPKVQTS